MWAALGTGKGALLGLNLSRDSWAQATNRSFAAMYAGMVINNNSAEVSWNESGDARANTSERCGKGGCSTLRYDVSYLDSTTSESLLWMRLFEVTELEILGKIVVSYKLTLLTTGHQRGFNRSSHARMNWMRNSNRCPNITAMLWYHQDIPKTTPNFRNSSWKYTSIDFRIIYIYNYINNTLDLRPATLLVTEPRRLKSPPFRFTAQFTRRTHRFLAESSGSFLPNHQMALPSGYLT